MVALFSSLLTDSEIGNANLTLRQFAVLESVYQPNHTAPGVRELTHSLNISKPSVTRSLDRLSVLGLIDRRTDPVDRRLVVIRTTKTGSAFVKRLRGLCASGMQAAA